MNRGGEPGGTPLLPGITKASLSSPLSFLRLFSGGSGPFPAVGGL